MLADQTADRCTHLADIVRHEPTHLGFCEASGLGAGGIWLVWSHSAKDLVWVHPWPAYIIADLFTLTNREGTITNSDLELAALVVHEATLLAAVPEARLAASRSGLDNTPTVSWSTKEASTINPVVADLIRLHTLHLRQFFINRSVIYHPEIKNTMADYASRMFEFSDTSFLVHMTYIYPQSQRLQNISLPPPDLLACVISTLCRRPCERELHKILASRGSTSSGETSVPPSRSILLSKIHPSLVSRSCKYMGIRSDTPSTPSPDLTHLGRSQFFRHGARLR